MTRKLILDVITVVVTIVACMALTVFLEARGVGLLGFLALSLFLGFVARTLSGLSLLDD